jgi:NitT/TauT family transport system ATP-binding protein
MPDVGDSPLLDVHIAAKSRVRNGADVPVIDELQFALDRGAITCLVGPSGCGKTTALRIIMGLDEAFEGWVRPPATHLRLGAVFQDPRLLPWRTIEANVRLAAPKIGADEVESLLTELGLEGWGKSFPGQLSLGMARRAALARALAVDPDLLILDEAFVSLDERSAEALRSVVFAAVARRRTTVLMVTHNMREALRYSDQLLVLAPRPTRVVKLMRLDRPYAERDAAWLETMRTTLEAAASFLDARTDTMD